MTSKDSSHPLDDMGWSSLAGPHADLALCHGNARRYPDGMPLFGAFQGDEASGLRDLAALLEPGGLVALASLPEDLGRVGLRHLSEIHLIQMVSEVPLDMPDRKPVELDASDVAATLELVELTQPGPFGPRSLEMGRYVGYRDEAGSLVAMAGERLRPVGHTEVSAVCTHPEHQRKGLGEAAVRAIVHGIQARGDVACLHVEATGKKSAHLLAFYERLGFRKRRPITIFILQKTAV